jgi:large subunit ribosomal protein L4e
MATVRPTLTVFGVNGKKTAQVAAPAVFSAPIRTDIVTFVHTNMAKNRRQPYAVKYEAGMQHSAESWGTGRALSRIPRVAGGGTSRSGQGAFGNMCRKGRMYSPTKVWRKWHRKTQLNQKRYATVSAIAASASPSLVMARGHSIGRVQEVPLVVDTAAQGIKKTKEAVAMLKALGAGADVARCLASRKATSGKSHLRSRTQSCRVGPLVVYSKDSGIVRACRNLPGVETINVNRLNLLLLAPGGSLGRFIVWTKDAVEQLNSIFGTFTECSQKKKGYKLPRSVMANADLDRIINSNEIQSVLRFRRTRAQRQLKFNPLTNFRAKIALNPYALVVRRQAVARQLNAKKVRAAKLAKKAANPVPKREYKLSERSQKRFDAMQTIAKNYKANRLEKIAYSHKRTQEIAKAAKEAAKKATKAPAAAAKGGKK